MRATDFDQTMLDDPSNTHTSPLIAMLAPFIVAVIGRAKSWSPASVRALAPAGPLGGTRPARGEGHLPGRRPEREARVAAAGRRAKTALVCPEPPRRDEPVMWTPGTAATKVTLGWFRQVMATMFNAR
ncbi:hypothetical protein ACQP00_19410 [Dactylosporangium sp. CS-047395]|uniref:hypothetical protein n=1 Tax=Dactylosporangium sp. CS-047395 TaxID=3239936 RepID=UPI003D94E183